VIAIAAVEYQNTTYLHHLQHSTKISPLQTRPVFPSRVPQTTLLKVCLVAGRASSLHHHRATLKLLLHSATYYPRIFYVCALIGAVRAIRLGNQNSFLASSAHLSHETFAGLDRQLIERWGPPAHEPRLVDYEHQLHHHNSQTPTPSSQQSRHPIFPALHLQQTHASESLACATAAIGTQHAATADKCCSFLVFVRPVPCEVCAPF
jgi:hypothetical protein